MEKFVIKLFQVALDKILEKTHQNIYIRPNWISKFTTVGKSRNEYVHHEIKI